MQIADADDNGVAMVMRMILSMNTVIAKTVTQDGIEYKLMTIMWSREKSKPQVGLSFSWEQ
jgi:hypothetical protein